MKKEKKQIAKNIVQYTTEDSRFYEITDKKGKSHILPSVTYILKSLPMNDQLLRWYCDMGYDHAKEYMEEKATMGSAVHQACENLLKGETITHDFKYEGREISSTEWKAILSFVDWHYNFTKGVKEVKILAVEKTYFDFKLKCAGTVDLVLSLDGVVHVIDLKTSAYIYPSHEVQISVYGKMVADDLKIKEVNRSVLLLGYSKNKKGYFHKTIEDKLGLFKAVKVLHDADHKDETIKTIELPTSAKL